ncbi:thaumatin family-domain-containing protein [Protomyces lactucae-debilis]|uniref:Thaumatin family-domain-containing protein n=1 Tax=Protomyces lactucae-debilis TaxID=2754530 RepID=A0A1Y2FV70_PROLT|nr:thaumatin family-domain-containing protein [Protomyces lactucae-debilis]ORY87913.1 thaumatin family-domain-containing protein [Protomyces lactucae-debilis]
MQVAADTDVNLVKQRDGAGMKYLALAGKISKVQQTPPSVQPVLPGGVAPVTPVNPTGPQPGTTVTPPFATPPASEGGPITQDPGNNPTGTSASTDGNQFTIRIVNNHTETIWPAIGFDTQTDPAVLQGFKGGFQLKPGQSHDILLPLNKMLSGGRIWARTGCTGSGEQLTCAVGNCHTNTLECKQDTGVQSVTLAEFTLTAGGDIWYNNSLLSGKNLGVTISTNGTPNAEAMCETFPCTDSAICQGYVNDPNTGPVGKCTVAQSKVFTVAFN